MVREIDTDIQIEVAHRSPTYTLNPELREKPRPIHALCATRADRDTILEKGPKKFKETPIGEKYVYVSDDVHPLTRGIHKRLLHKQREFRDKGWLAYIPWRVPRVLKYRPGPKGSNTGWKTYKIQGLQ
jgi:hypothetical protein